MEVGTGLQINGEQLQTALEAAGVGIWDYDPVHDVLVWSAHCCRLFGITVPCSISPDTFIAGVHPDDKEKALQDIGRALQPTADTYDAEYRTIGLQDGIQRWVRATGKAFFDANGMPYRFTGTIIDITARKEAEQKHLESEQRFRTMADNAPVMIWVTNADGYCTYLNERWLAYTGQTMEEGAGLGWTAAVHPDDRENVKQNFIQANKQHSEYRCEYRLRARDGQYQWMIDSALPRLGDNGVFLGYIGSVLDISDRRAAEEALRFRSAQLEAQNEASTDGLLLVDTKDNILSYNKRFTAIWNIPRHIINTGNGQAALHFALAQLVDPDAFMSQVDKMHAQNTETVYDEVRFKDGRLLERWGRAVTGQDGTYYGWLLQFRDVTARRAEQQELSLRTAMLEAQNESSPLGILVIDAKDKNVYYFNKRYVEIYDLPPELLPAPTRAQLLDHFRKTIVNFPAFMEKIQYLYENPVSGSQDVIELVNGKIIERYGYPIKSKKGDYYGWTWQFRDITEQRRAEESLRQKNAQLESLIQEFKFFTDFMPQIVWVTQPDGHHDFFNAQWYRFTGLDHETTKDKGWLLVLHPDDYERTWQKWQHALSSGEAYEAAYRLRRHDGVYIWFLARATPMYNAQGALLKWFGTCTNIHDQRMAAGLLEQKVTERTQQLQEVNKNLERSNAELEQFAYVASHDLQEPLRKIRTFSNLLQNELQHESHKKAGYYVERIWHSSSRMQELIKDLLNFSRLGQWSREDFGLTDLNTVVRNVLEDLELKIQQKGAVLDIGVLPQLQASTLQMHQLFFNLLNNALKFGQEGLTPQISVQSTPAAGDVVEAHNLPPAAGPYYLITVSDNGIGFKNQYAAQIFTVFQRLHNKDTFEGTGIGLALCKKVVTNHRGAIFARGEENKGATFYILLPQHQKPDA